MTRDELREAIARERYKLAISEFGESWIEQTPSIRKVWLNSPGTDALLAKIDEYVERLTIEPLDTKEGSELTRLRALEDRLLRYIGYCKATLTKPSPRPNFELYVVNDHLDDMLSRLAENGDEDAKRFLEPGSGKR